MTDIKHFEDSFNKGNIKTAYLNDYLRQNVFIDTRQYNTSEELANFIGNNLSNLQENDVLLFNLYKKIITQQKMYKDLLTYEFLYASPSKTINNIDTLIILVQDELKKYQGIIGAYYVEDNNWIICTKDCRFKLKETQKAIYNTICKRVAYDDDNKWFFEKLIIRIKKYLPDNSHIKIDYKIIDDEENEICWILIVFELKENYITCDDNVSLD